MQNYESYSAKQFLDDASFIKWVKGTSPDVNRFWNDWTKSEPANLEEMRAAEKQLRAILTAKQIKPEEEDAQEVWGRIDNSIFKTTPSKVRRIPQRWWAAAAIFLLLTTGSYFFLNNEHSKKEVAVVKKNVLINDIPPGGNKAILTLANGSTIILNNAKNGALTQQGNTKVVKLDDGKLAYQPQNISSRVVQYNTVSTPRGGQYQLTLADGSKVWLNAESSITFPTAFNGNERKVEIKGEAYFEVAHDATKPFEVTANGMEVKVLGTHFNINSYEDENVIKTTLLEGSVKVTKGTESKVITPGEQAVVSSNNKKILVSDADVDEAVAWKNGLFHFNNVDLPEVMRQLSRWYDVDVVYNKTIPKREFGGEMQRDLKLSQVLELLEKNDVHFKIDGKKIIVMPEN